MPRANPYAGRVSALSREGFEQLQSAVAERRCREEYGFGTFAEAAAERRPHPPCPSCGDGAPFKDGIGDSGLQRHRRRSCGCRFNSLTGTVLERGKKGLPAWMGFIRLMRWNVPLDAIAEPCGISHQIAREWRHRAFATVDGYRGGIVLRDRIWIDETCINDTDLTRGYGEARKRGLSKQKLCIAVAIDAHKNPVAVVCGHGKPSTKRMKNGLLSHMGEGSVVVRDMEEAHKGLVKAAKRTDEAYKADVKDPVYLECMAMVNNLCSWIKRYLWRFTGMDPANLQSYLNWYVYLFRVNQAQDKWPKTERVVRHLLMAKTQCRSSRA